MPDINKDWDDIWRKIDEPWEMDRRIRPRPMIPTPFPVDPIDPLDTDITRELKDILEEIRRDAKKQKKTPNPIPKKNNKQEKLDRDEQENGPTIQEEF